MNNPIMAFHQALVKLGKPPVTEVDPDRADLINVDGKPISEIIIEDRKE